MRLIAISLMLAATVALAGCQAFSRSAAVGAGAGAVVGGLATGRPIGMIAGAIAGGVTGELIGRVAGVDDQCYFRDANGDVFRDTCPNA